MQAQNNNFGFQYQFWEFEGSSEIFFEVLLAVFVRFTQFARFQNLSLSTWRMVWHLLRQFILLVHFPLLS